MTENNRAIVHQILARKVANSLVEHFVAHALSVRVVALYFVDNLFETPHVRQSQQLERPVRVAHSACRVYSRRNFVGNIAAYYPT